jgi:hypothetical protein
MASAVEQSALPLLYNGLEPLSSTSHRNWKLRMLQALPTMGSTHGVPITIDEFQLAQRHYPIIFSSGENPVPLALMGLNEGVNTFFDAEGKLSENAYVPAYIRRYPFILARPRPDTDELSLCFDPTAGAVGEFEEGEPLFDGDQPSEATQRVLSFCEQFETSAQRTGQFVQELIQHKLLIEGELGIEQEGNSTPYVYRGFQMVSEELVRELRGDVLRKMSQNGMLPLIYAHMFSLSLARDIFGRQFQQGKIPAPQAA